MPTRISIATARRFLAIRHLLAPPRALPGTPESVLAVVDRLGSLQFDPLEVAGRNHDLVLHARVAGYLRELTDELLYGRRLLFGDRLVGRIEPRIDRNANVVRILGLGWEAGFDPLDAPGFVPAFAAAINAYLAFGRADALLRPAAAQHRALFREVAAAVPVRAAADSPRRAGSAPRKAATV